MRTAARAYRIAGGKPRRSDRSCETRRGEVQPGPARSAPGPGGARPVGEIWSQQESRGLTARELIRLAQAVRLRPAHPPEESPPAAGRT
jgi:hypothetical protein